MPISGKWTEGELADRTQHDWDVFLDRKRIELPE